MVTMAKRDYVKSSKGCYDSLGMSGMSVFAKDQKQPQSGGH